MPRLHRKVKKDLFPHVIFIEPMRVAVGGFPLPLICTYANLISSSISLGNRPRKSKRVDCSASLCIGMAKGGTLKFFLDTANLDEIAEAASWGALAGVTTNPTLYSRVGGKLADFNDHIKRICDIVGPDCPVSAESLAMTRDELVRDGRELAAIAPNVVVKIPTMVEGLAATRTLADEGIPVNMTLCFTVPQALLAARAGARYISPFIGRFDDISEDGIEQVANIVEAIGNYDFTDNTVNGEQIEVIAASIRSANHVTQCALMGADIATVPFGVLKKMVSHPLTDRGIESFIADWEKVK